MSIDYTTITDACTSIRSGSLIDAKKMTLERGRFVPIESAKRRCTKRQSTRIFRRDGFVDRYSGERLVFPPVLRILSNLMPEEFPFHSNWKMSACHIAYWRLFPTIDHVVPLARGGEDDESNWVCTSQLRNNAKANWLLEELGWRLHDHGRSADWDGLIGWFRDYVRENSGILQDSYIERWHVAAVKEEVAFNAK